ncbi:MAG: zinc-binding dehydrogenase, partial [Rhodobacterales bacterium]|nr:zinc-binding dehydrogenase [Rhodobacterales bacterium]
ALVLASRGCRRIALAETNPLRLAAARSSGVCEPYDPTAEAGPEGVDVVIDAVGGAATRAAACAAVRPGGVIVHVGLMSSDGGLDIRKITLQEVTLVGCYTYTMVDFRATVDGMARGAFGPLDWFERRSLADGVGAFADLDAGRVSASKVILTPDGVS